MDTTDDERSTFSRRRTVELCGEERRGRSCVLPRNHDGKHDYHDPEDTVRLRRK